MQGGSGGAGARRPPRWSLVPSLCLISLVLATVLGTSVAEDNEFSCHPQGLFTSVEPDMAAIIPRGDINVQVGAPPVIVLCRFNDKYIKASDIYFRGKNYLEIPHKLLNSSTIQAAIPSKDFGKYHLSCMLRRKAKSDKDLCTQRVKTGYQPQDIQDLHCISRNNENLNCTWRRPYNPIDTNYTVTFKVPSFSSGSLCLSSTKTSCYWNSSQKKILREEFYLHIKAANIVGEKTYIHTINIPKVVLPDKTPVGVTLVGPTKARVNWNLTYPLDVFLTGLWHKADYRVQGEREWKTLTEFQHYASLKLDNQKYFSKEVQLPYANVEYEFRVRLHTLAGDIREDMWSDYDIVTIKARALPPTVAPKTHLSSFEVVEVLKARDVYVYFEDVEAIVRGGEEFHYKMLAYPFGHNETFEIKPKEMTKAYFKYPSLNFQEYKFHIIPVNEKGSAEVYSEVIVPNSDCMPKKTEMFTVISRKPIISLYWVPSNLPNVQCPGSASKIDSYTIYWCKQTYDDRCKEKLSWVTISDTDLITKNLSQRAITTTVLYEKNMTGFPADQLQTFGVAANAGNYSSGIRWARCVVDEADSPAAPSPVTVYNKNYDVVVKWDLKCSSLSTVPLGFNVSYCQSNIADFGHCLSEEHHVKIDSSEANSTIISEHLKPGISYIFSVSVLSYIGEGMQSRPRLVRIPAAKPTGPPLNLTVVSTTNTTAVIAWKAPKEDDRNGKITAYKITVPECNEPPTIFKVLPTHHAIYYEHGLKNLKPFETQHANVIACTSAGCGELDTAALTRFRTKEGVPNNVDLTLDVSNWRLMWDLEKCNSRICSFEVQASFNNTVKNATILDEDFLSLYKVGLNCTMDAMSFSIRAVGMDEFGKPLYGNWTTKEKEPNECPPAKWPLWVIILVVIGCAAFTFGVIVIMKYFWLVTRKFQEDKDFPFAVPGNIENPDTKSNLAKFMQKRRTSEPPLFYPPEGKHQCFPITRAEEKEWVKIVPRSSISSEEVNLIENAETERHGRNLSGSSQQSSGQDSAMMSESPSVTGTDPDASLTEEMELRQRMYVKAGAAPDKGYVTARSVPNLCNGGPGIFEKANPNLNGNLAFTSTKSADLKHEQFILARRASTGYVSMIVDADSGKTSPCQRDPFNQEETTGSGMPSYSRHSFDPSALNGRAVGKSSPPQFSWLSSGYVALADPLSNGPSSSPYVSASDPFGGAKHPPKTAAMVDEDSFPTAYCKVGSRDEASAGQRESDNSMPSTGGAQSKSPYLTTGEAFLIGRQRPSEGKNTVQHNHPEISQHTPYVQLADAKRWAQSVFNPVSSEASHQGLSSLERHPNTTESAIGRDGTPSLSKQSSGYDSQEAIPVVISPKKLLAQSQTPHLVVLSQNHQASMV